MTTPAKAKTSEVKTANTPKLPRGLRNCNPLNIKRGDNWIGLAVKQTDPVFCRFTDMKFGYRAALVILRRYINGYHLNTISAIVNRWAPDGGLNYIQIVSNHMGVHPHFPLSFNNRQQMTLLLEGMTKAECGRLADREDVNAAFKLL